MTLIQTINLLQDELLECAKAVRPEYYVEPVNEKAQKAEFLAGKIINPEFRYKKIEYDPAEIERRLKQIKTPNDVLGKILKQKIKDVLGFNELIKNRGNEKIIRKISAAINGKPDTKLVAYAEKLLRTVPNTAAEKTVSSKAIKDALQKGLKQYGLTDWQVKFSDKKMTTVDPALKLITVCKDRMFTKQDIERIRVHEVGIHAVRAANGYAQLLKLFATGIPGYLPTEEGLTTYFEEKTGNSSKELMRDYAGRVIAVDCVCKGSSFRKTFKKLKSYAFTDDQAWNLCVRAYRGGGYVKDHVYLKGFLKVKRYAENGNDMKLLFVGKIGIEQLQLVRALLKKGMLKKAKIMPEFVERAQETNNCNGHNIYS